MNRAKMTPSNCGIRGGQGRDPHGIVGDAMLTAAVVVAALLALGAGVVMEVL